MYSKEEAQKIRTEFWITFAKQYPKKWLLYNTKIKNVAFKFFADNKKAQVLLEISSKATTTRQMYFQKIQSLQTVLKKEYLPEAIFEENFYLENAKVVSRVWVEIINVSINNKATWPTIFSFFNEKMNAFELFFYEFEDYIKSDNNL